MANFSYTITNINDNLGTITIQVTVGAQTFTKRFQTQGSDLPLGVPTSSKIAFENWLRRYVVAYKAGRAQAKANASAQVAALVSVAQSTSEDLVAEPSV